mmetsp:Transcript_14357/g.29557  ORF Transcript_14357/g.29557 Transcript_14357/m.29557 type:complete len:299 (+) Transcript_14357:399-1295(+)
MSSSNIAAGVRSSPRQQPSNPPNVSASKSKRQVGRHNHRSCNLKERANDTRVSRSPPFSPSPALVRFLCCCAPWCRCWPLCPCQALCQPRPHCLISPTVRLKSMLPINQLVRLMHLMHCRCGVQSTGVHPILSTVPTAIFRYLPTHDLRGFPKFIHTPEGISEGLQFSGRTLRLFLELELQLVALLPGMVNVLTQYFIHLPKSLHLVPVRDQEHLHVLDTLVACRSHRRHLLQIRYMSLELVYLPVLIHQRLRKSPQFLIPFNEHVRGVGIPMFLSLCPDFLGPLLDELLVQPFQFIL